MRLSIFKQKLLFLLITAVFFGLLLFRLEFLTAPQIYDEIPFWNASLEFSDRLIPTLSSLRNYSELNTPLPFIIYGALERISGRGFIAGRLLNIALLLAVSVAIGWPKPSNYYNQRSLLCLIGLLLFPYNFIYGGRLYTDVIASTFVLLGIVSHQQNRHLLSSISFILAISSRQFMVAFPAAVALYEFAAALPQLKHPSQIDLSKQQRWLFPLAATLSLLGWIYLFQGLTPQAEEALTKVDPRVQTTAWAVAPGRAINYLSSVATYIVIPEFLLFRRWRNFSFSKQQRRLTIVAAAMLVAIAIVSPPLLYARNAINLIAGIFNNTQYEYIGAAIYCLFSLLVIIRFSKPSLLSVMVLTNSLIMAKVYPWDKYLWPFVIVFWYLKATQPIENQYFRAANCEKSTRTS